MILKAEFPTLLSTSRSNVTQTVKILNLMDFFVPERLGLLNTFATLGLNTSGPLYAILIKTVIQKTWGKEKGG